jgi:hypothetical protein
MTSPGPSNAFGVVHAIENMPGTTHRDLLGYTIENLREDLIQISEALRFLECEGASQE